MGMFDTVMVPCPTCGELAGFQSKSGHCQMEDFTLEEAPDDVLSDVNRHAPTRCRKCSTLFAVDIQPRTLKQATPPTIDQVREHEWWWNFPIDGKPHVLQLDIEDGRIIAFTPEDWQGAWAPCIPPAENETRRPRTLAARSVVWVEAHR